MIPADISLVLLCGGEGRRMGGQDKPLLTLHGQMLVEYVLAALVPLTGSVLISANRHLQVYQALGYPVFPDQPGHAGPLAGLAAVADQVGTEYVFVCPGDLPLIAPELVHILCGVLVSGAEVMETETGNTAGNAAYIDDGERAHYLPFLMRTELLTELPAWLDGGGRAVRHWHKYIGSVAASHPECAAQLVNVNTPDELQLLEQRLSTLLKTPRLD